MQPRIDRSAEAPGLRVVRVHVVLALHVVAAELEQPADGIAEDRAAAVADMERPGRVDARELHLQPFPTPYPRRAVTGAGLADLTDQPLQPFGRELEVHVAPYRLHCGGAIGDRNGFRQLRSDGRRRLPQRLGQLESSRARVIPTVGSLGATQLEVGQISLDPERADSRRQALGDHLANGLLGHLAHAQTGCCPASVSWTWVDAPARE